MTTSIGDKLNNHASNLRWCTPYQNANFDNYNKDNRKNSLKGNHNACGRKPGKHVRNYIYTLDGVDYKIRELCEFLGCSKSAITEAFRKNHGLVKQGRLTRR